MSKIEQVLVVGHEVVGWEALGAFEKAGGGIQASEPTKEASGYSC
jgi:hypothetical protein